MNFNIAVLAGDGIGPEISVQGVNVMKAVCDKFSHTVQFTEALVGGVAIDATGSPFPSETREICLASDAVLFSAIGDAKYDNNPESKVRPEQGLLAMRKELGVYANIRPIRAIDSMLDSSPLKRERIEGVDFICVRELIGGMYFGDKHEGEDSAYDTNSYSRMEVERILHVAFDYAISRRKHLTVVDKANVLATSRLWRKIAMEMSVLYPSVELDFMFVDNAAMKLIQEPRFFDVIVTDNIFGDILSDEASVLCGSMGLIPSASLGEGTPLFEPIHGSWYQAKGLNIANPLAQILSVAMLFDYFNCTAEAALIRRAVDESIKQNICTPDIQQESDKKYGTKEVGEWIVKFINTKK